MADSLKTLLTSKRAMVAVLTAVIDVLLLLGVMGIPEQTAETLATLVTTIGGVLIAGISASDTGTALTMPANVDHKGRELP